MPVSKSFLAIFGMADNISGTQVSRGHVSEVTQAVKFNVVYHLRLCGRRHFCILPKTPSKADEGVVDENTTLI
jgi:hypothetical protein